MGLAHSPSIVTNGLVFCLDAGNRKSYTGSGSTWTDISGNSNHGTLSDTFNQPSGDRASFDTDTTAGGNLYFPDNFGTVNTQVQLAGTSFTVSSWIKFPSPSSGAKLWGAGISYAPSAGGGYTVVLNNATTISDSLWGGDTSYTVNIAADTWYNITTTMSNNSPYQRKLYINGIQNPTSPSGIQYTGTGGLRIGYYGASDTTNWGNNGFKKVASFVLYNRVLSTNEILQNFNALRGRFGI